MAIQKTAGELLEKIRTEANVSPEIKQKAEQLYAELAVPVISDTWIYRAVVVVLGMAALSTVIGGLLLAAYGDSDNYKIPAEIVALGSAAIGALAGLLAPSPREAKSSDPTRG